VASVFVGAQEPNGGFTDDWRILLAFDFEVVKIDDKDVTSDVDFSSSNHKRGKFLVNSTAL
jgi:hypothetical protein